MATGTSMRVAERAGGRGPTVRVPGIAAAAAAAAAALAAVHWSPEAPRPKRRSRSWRQAGAGAAQTDLWGSGAAAAGSGPPWRSPTATPAPIRTPVVRLSRPCCRMYCNVTKKGV